MLNKQRMWIALLGFAAVIFVDCTSQEYTSAKLYIQQQEWEKAEEFLIKAVDAEPENPEIPYQLGYHIYGVQKKDWEKMNQSFDRALTIDPNKKILGQEKTVKEFVVMAQSQFWAEIYNKGVVEFNEYQAASSDSASNAAMKKAITTFEVSARIKPAKVNSGMAISKALSAVRYISIPITLKSISRLAKPRAAMASTSTNRGAPVKPAKRASGKRLILLPLLQAGSM